MASSPMDEKKGEFYHDEQVDAAGGQDKFTVDQIEAAYFNTAGLSSSEVSAVRSAALAAALKQSPINARSRASMMLYFCGFVELAGPQVSKIFSLYNAGSMVGALFAGPIADYFGRRVGMFAGGAFIVCGACITTAAKNIDMLIGGRFILGFGIAIMTVGAPAYITEIAPAHWRGRMVGIYNNGWNGGGIPAAAICYGCSYLKGNAAWRIPMALQGSFSVAIMFCVFFIPESPRWHVQHGRDEEALAFLVKYHGNGDPNSALVRLEMAEMKASRDADNGSDKRWWDYSDLFRTKNARYRMLSVLLISIFGQFSGNGLGYFNYVIYNNLGYTSPQTQLALTLGGSFLSAICGVTGAAFADRMPRVKVLTIGTAICAVFLAINGGLSEVIAQMPKDATGNPIITNKGYGQGALAANYLFGVVYAFTYTPLQGVYPAENLTNSTRAKGLAASGIIVSLFGFINTYAGPIALQNMGNKYIFVFVAWDLIEAVVWFFCGVETVGKTLEELEEAYNAPYPPFASRKKTKIAVTADNRVVELVE